MPQPRGGPHQDHSCYVHSGQSFLFPSLLPKVAAHLSGKHSGKTRWWESWTTAVLPAALRSEGTCHAPSQQLGGSEMKWSYLLLHPTHARPTSPEFLNSDKRFHPGEDKRDALGKEQCQCKHSGWEMIR